MGIDIGARASKAVITEDGKLKAHHLLLSGTNYKETARMLKEELLAKAGLSAESTVCTVATGVGGQNIDFSQQYVAELRCCARGVSHIFPEVRTIIDIGETSSRLILTDGKGRLINFIVSEKCATGSGYFLETIANVLRVKLEDVGSLSLSSRKPVFFTTGCAVFGESEAISRVCEGFSKGDILAGVHKALANKISALAARLGLEEPCAISGGGGLDIGLVRNLEKKVGVNLLLPREPQLVTALGAALIARELSEGNGEREGRQSNQSNMEERDYNAG